MCTDYFHTHLNTRFLFPIDGDHVNAGDGTLADDTLLLPVRILAPAGARVEVNGIPAIEADGALCATVPLSAGWCTLIAKNLTAGTEDCVRVFCRTDGGRYFRISSDDNILFLADLNSHPEYTSIFDNPYLAIYRKAHELYGAKVHLNLFYSFPGSPHRHFSAARPPFDLSMMTDRYKAEFEANSDWLKLSFHARSEHPSRPYQNADAATVLADYEAVRREVVRFAGERTFSGDVTTIHWGAVTKEGVAALRDAGHRALMGYFYHTPKGEAMVSYYAPDDLVRHIGRRDFFTDLEMGMTFGRIDLVTNLSTLPKLLEEMREIIASPTRGGFVSFMIHEQFFYGDFIDPRPDFEARVLEPARMLYEAGYRGRLIREVLPLA